MCFALRNLLAATDWREIIFYWLVSSCPSLFQCQPYPYAVERAALLEGEADDDVEEEDEDGDEHEHEQ